MLNAALCRGNGVSYQSWLLDLVCRAWRAGLQAVGCAMELMVFRDEEDDEEQPVKWVPLKCNTMS